MLSAGLIIGLLALCWSRAQTQSHRLTVIDPATGKEIHTLSLDQQNCLVSLLEASGQTNAIAVFHQYRCADRTGLASLEIRDTIAILRQLREGHREQAIYLLDQHLSRYVSLMCNGYGGLNPTNRERVNLKSLEQARDYFATFPHPEWGTGMANQVNQILRPSERPQK